MRGPFQIFIGYDSREPLAYAVCAHSILRRATVPITISPLTIASVKAGGLYTRERTGLESTEFSFSRFLVPALCGFEGTAVFIDCDFLVRYDITELFAYPLAFPDAAVHVCQHDYTPKDATKFLGQPQTAYPRKNWSSLMVFNNERCKALTPEFVNRASGLELHRLVWAGDAVGSVPLEWNWLVGEYEPNPKARALHFTLGGPWFNEYRHVDHADLWREELASMCGGAAVVV